MKIAVVGGGLFGCTAAIYAARLGHEVHLYEANGDIMQGATGRNYFRLHRGYHYPRSRRTGLESISAEASFRKEYGLCVVDSGRQFYAIANEGSRVSGQEFMAFMDRMGLPYLRVQSDLIRNCDHVFEVNEPRVDIGTLRRLVWNGLASAGVDLHLASPMPVNVRDRFDKIILATYAGLGDTCCDLGLEPEVFKFQVVEKPVLRGLGHDFNGTSIVILDGEFCCLDPHGSSEMAVLGHVTGTVHHEHVGTFPMVPKDLKWALESGLVISAQNKGREVMKEAGKFIRHLGDAEYMGSIYTTRAVLAGVEATDERPTHVRRRDDQVVQIFSGKLGTAVSAAKAACAYIETRQMVAA